MREYTKEFYKLNLRVVYVGESTKKVARYVNGIRMDIQEEINMILAKMMEEVYQCALREEENIARKKSFNKDNSSARGREKAIRRGIFGPRRGESSNSNQQEHHGRGGDHSRRGPYQGGRGRGTSRETVIRCYKCNQLEHKSFECLGKDYVG